MKKRYKGAKIFLIITVSLILTIILTIGAVSAYVLCNIDFDADEALFVDAKTEKNISVFYDLNGNSSLKDYNPALYEQVCCADDRIWYEYKEISPYLLNGFIAVEDRGFFEHHGVDIKRTMYAAINYIFKGSKSFGGSTITQQLIKNISGSKEKTIKRKIDEIIRAYHLEYSHPKEEIFELYLNVIPMSNNITGVGMASKLFFSKEPSELSAAEAATLIAMANAPTKYNPINNPSQCLEKRNIILRVMYEEGVIDEAEYGISKSTPLSVKKSANEPVQKNSWFSCTVVGDVINDMMKEYGYSYDAAKLFLYKNGAKIYATVDPQLQEMVENYFSNSDNFPKECEKGLQYSMVLCDNKNCELKAIVGDFDNKNQGRKYNYATLPQTPGSVLKPLALYLPLIDSHEITWSTVFDDVPVSFRKNADGSYTEYPKNSPARYDGLITVSDALRISKNTVAVRLYNILGAEKIYKYLTDNFGFDTLVYSEKNQNGKITDLAPSPLALGQLSRGISLRKLTEAYTVFPNEGILCKGRSYVAVFDENGNSILENREETKTVCNRESARIMNQLLMNVVENGTASKITLKSLYDTAGKTGTSGCDLDRLFIGYTPYYTAGIWCGYKDNVSAVGNFEKNHFTVWDDVMKEIHKIKIQASESEKHFSVQNLMYEPFCIDSGECFCEACLGDLRGNRLAYGYFIKGTEPRENCTRHISVAYDEIFPYDRKISFVITDDRTFPKAIYVGDQSFSYHFSGSNKKKK